MSCALPAWPLLVAFAIASLVLAATPGPGVLYIVTRTLAQGRRAGLASVAGVALGNLGNALAASLGLAALLAVSTLVFDIVKYAGAAYLLYLGIKALRGSTRIGSATAPVAAAPSRILRDGFVVSLLNPKTALFSAAVGQRTRLGPRTARWLNRAVGTLFVAFGIRLALGGRD